MDYKEILDGLSEKEKQAALKILSEYSDKGVSEYFNHLVKEDYKETPVDIITFIKDDRYLGRAWHTPSGKCKLYPYWEKKLKELFPDPYTTNFNTFIESGARGLGKSEVGVTCGLYLMHRLMCLKNPHEFLNLKPSEKVAFAFMNITKILAEEIGISKFQNTVRSSPWFCDRGTITQKDNEPYWNPPDFINIIIGSQASHVIGQAVYFCLDGDTVILTSNGNEKLRDLQDKSIRVASLSEDGSVILSDVCTVKETAISTEEYQIELEDGSIVKCTPNHRFLLTTGEYKEAQNLTIEDEIMDFIPYGYIYKTINTINNKIYIGQKKSNIFLGNSYIGSGNIIKKAIQKYGKEYFTVELLEYCSSKKDLDLKEKYYIDLYNSTDLSSGYNIANGGQGGNLGEECNKRISKKLMNHFTSDDTKKKISDTLKNKHHKLSDHHKELISIANKCKIVSYETRSKISSSNKGKLKGRSAHNKGKVLINNGTETKFIDDNEHIPDGWKLGNPFARHSHNMSSYTEEMRLHRKEISSGYKNNNYGQGWKQSGGRNGKATIRYFFDNKTFECKKDFINYYCNTYGYISENAVRCIVNGTFGTRISNKYQHLISGLTWENKNED